MKLIETKALTSANASIVFSNIPQTFTDLYVLTSLRDTTGTVGWVTCDVRPNGTGSNISSRALYGFNTTVGSFAPTEVYHQATQGGNTANTFSSSSIYISNYAGSTHKSFSVDTSTEGNTATTINAINASLWSDTAAITSLTFLIAAGQTLASGSTISLYGIGGAGDGGPKAVGGMITKSGDYWVHTFTSSGTFTPTANLSNVEYLVVAGGGGGGFDRAGGGGAGGYRSSVVGQSSGGGASAESRLSLAAGNYTVTVGSGGAGGNSSTPFGSDGINSTFSSITSIGGGGGAYGFVNAALRSGGSGGGSGGQEGGFGLTGGAGTTDQGFKGGNGIGSPFHGAGGGGANSVGANATGSGAGNGGQGIQSNITGSLIGRAGGGGGARNATSGGTSGSGFDGGGNGGAGNGGTAPTAGTPNTGGGGGAGSNNPTQNGATGGSGIVIVRYPV